MSPEFKEVIKKQTGALLAIAYETEESGLLEVPEIKALFKATQEMSAHLGLIDDAATIAIKTLCAIMSGISIEHDQAAIASH